MSYISKDYQVFDIVDRMQICKLFFDGYRRSLFVVYSANVLKKIKGGVQETQSPQNAEGLGNLYSPQVEKTEKKSPLNTFITASYVVLSILSILFSIALMAVAVSTAIALNYFSTEQSGRLVALIILTISAAITISICIYGMIALLRNQSRPVRAASVILIILAIVQSVILGTTMRITDQDELKVSLSLSESFRLSREANPRYTKLWAMTQHDLNCCGVSSPNDYRNSELPNFFYPDVPISCCPSYEPNRSDLVQERARELCKARKEYHNLGCRVPILQLYKSSAVNVIVVTTVLIALMVLISIFGVIWIYCCKKRKSENPGQVVVIEGTSG